MAALMGRTKVFYVNIGSIAKLVYKGKAYRSTPAFHISIADDDLMVLFSIIGKNIKIAMPMRDFGVLIDRQELSYYSKINPLHAFFYVYNTYYSIASQLITNSNKTFIIKHYNSPANLMNLKPCPHCWSVIEALSFSGHRTIRLLPLACLSTILIYCKYLCYII
jgi:hypothetical protein